MKWTDLIRRVAERSGQSQQNTRAVLSSLIETAQESLAEGDDVPLRLLGTLSSSWREERTLRSVSDSRTILLDGRYVARFRPSAPLKALLAARTPQHMRDPAHQEAWRVAQTLIGDLDLYYSKSAPKDLEAGLTTSDTRARCAEAFGGVWAQVAESYDARVGPEVRLRRDHLAEVALKTWAG